MPNFAKFGIADTECTGTNSRAALLLPATRGEIILMAAEREKSIRIALGPDVDHLLTRAARECGVSRAEFVRRRLVVMLEQYRRQPKSRSARRISSDRTLDDETAEALSAAIASTRKRRRGRLTELRDPWAS